MITTLPCYRDEDRPYLAFVSGIAAPKVIDVRRSQCHNRSHPVSEVCDTTEVRAGSEQHAMNCALSKQMVQLPEILPPQRREIPLLFLGELF